MTTIPIKLKLRVLWFKDCLGLAIDQQGVNQAYPLTPYYIWPRTEAWEQLKLELDSRPWLPNANKVLILNLTTEVMNSWREYRKLESPKLSPRFHDINFVEIQN